MTLMLTPEIEQRLRALIVEMIESKRGRASIGPADVARRFDAEHWKRWMDSVKEIARRLATEGVIQVTRHGKPIEAWPWRGVVRFRARSEAGAGEAGLAEPDAD